MDLTMDITDSDFKGDTLLSSLFSLDSNTPSSSSIIKKSKSRNTQSCFRPRDDLWKFFNTTNNGSYSCKICFYKFKGRPSTTVAKRHFEKRHKLKLSDPDAKTQTDLVSTLLGTLLNKSGDFGLRCEENQMDDFDGLVLCLFP
jgi:hypothetical protein